ncbi:hypothetical protein D3C78_1814320 [compost metagenome]
MQLALGQLLTDLMEEADDFRVRAEAGFLEHRGQFRRAEIRERLLRDGDVGFEVGAAEL